MEGPSKYLPLFDALSKRSFDEVAKAAYRILDMPIVVTDAAFLVVAKYPTEALGDEQWDANVVGRQIAPRFLETFREDDHFSVHSRERKAVLIDWGHYSDRPRLTSLIHADGMVAGFISALTTGKTVEPRHWDEFAMVVDAYSVLFGMRAYARAESSEFLSGYLYSLLDGTVLDEDGARVIDAAFSERVEPPYVLVAVRPDNPHDASLETYIGSEFERRFGRVVQTVYGGVLYILFGGVKVGQRTSARMVKIGDMLSEYDARGGFSRPFSSLYPLSAYKWQADSALRVGSMASPASSVLHYEELMLDIALDAVVAGVPRENLEHPALAILRRSDAQEGSEYARTLAAFIESRYDRKATAEALHIHRNTLLYRLGRIKELTGVDPSDRTLSAFLSIEEHMRKHAVNESDRAAGAFCTQPQMKGGR